MRSLLLPYCLLAVPATALNLQQNTALPCRLAASAAVDPQYAAVHTASRRGFGQHSLAWAAVIAAVVAPQNSGAWAVAPTEEEVAAAAKARNEEVLLLEHPKTGAKRRTTVSVPSYLALGIGCMCSLRFHSCVTPGR